jgi:hypothetical protein
MIYDPRDGFSYLDIFEFANQSYVSLATARQWIQAGTIPGYRRGRRTFVRLDDAQSFLRRIGSGCKQNQDNSRLEA